jgi:ParB family chromosome partitioning protein
MVPRRGLGRGLGALLASSPTEGEPLFEVSIDDIRPNPNQPRKVFEADGLQELAASIRASGLLQPVIARRTAQDTS